MLKKLKKKFRKTASIGTAATLILTGGLQGGINVIAAGNGQQPPADVELVASSQNGSLNAIQGTTVNFNIQLSLGNNDNNVDATVAVNTKYYLNGQGNGGGNNSSITSDTPTAAQALSKNGVITIPASVTVGSNYKTGNILVPITVTIINGGKNNTAPVVNVYTDYISINVLSGDTTAPVVNISSPVNNGYFNSSTLPTAPVYSVVEANNHTEAVSGWDKTEGTHTVTVTSTDASGNAGQDSATYTVDNTAPSISTTIVEGGIYKGSALQNQGKYYSVQDANPNTESATPLDYTEGDHIATITATDKAGNQSTKTIHYTVDNTAPSITFKFNNNGFYKSSYLSGLNPYYIVQDAHLNPNGVSAPSLDLREGNRSVTVSATDLAGNSNSSSTSYTVDDTAPSVSIKLDPSKIYNEAAITALGDYYTAEDTNLLNVSASALEKNADGTHSVTVTAVDKAGNDTTKTVSYNVDNTKPVISINEKLENGGYYQSSSLESIKDSFFTATDAHLKNKSNTSLDLSEGVHTLSVSATDEAGNTTTQSITYTIDNTAPKVNFNIKNDSYLTSEALENLLNEGEYYSTSDNIATVSVVADRLNTEEDTHTLTVVAKDAAGNETKESVKYTIDNTVPAIDFNYTYGGIYNAKDLSLDSLYNASDINLVGAEVKNPADLVLTEGSHTVTIVATDKAGNSKIEDFTYTIDNTAPSIEFNFKNDGYFNSKVLEGQTYYNVTDVNLDGYDADSLDLTEGSHSAKVTATDKALNLSKSTFHYTIDNTAPSIGFNFTNGGFFNSKALEGKTYFNVSDLNIDSTKAGALELTEGSHSAKVTATDKALNSSDDTFNYTIDNTNPSIEFTIKNGGVYNSKALEGKDYYSVSDLNLDSTNADSLNLTEGSHTVSVTAKDKAGNVSTQTITYTIDNTAPVVSFSGITEGQRFVVGQDVSVNWSAADANLVSSVIGSIKLDTTTAGIKTITIPASTDKAGNVTPAQTYTYHVYNWSGVQQPINADGKSSFKLGSTIPVKFQLLDGNSYLSDATVSIRVLKLNSAVATEVNEVVSTAAATEGALFRYDLSGNQYIYNLSTKNLTEGQYRIDTVITVDGNSITKSSQTFNIKK